MSKYDSKPRITYYNQHGEQIENREITADINTNWCVEVRHGGGSDDWYIMCLMDLVESGDITEKEFENFCDNY